MTARLSKREVEVILAAVDGPPDSLRSVLASALTRLGGSAARVASLESLDQDALWDLAAQLNETRELPCGW